jgi:hypothetical protein
MAHSSGGEVGISHLLSAENLQNLNARTDLVRWGSGGIKIEGFQVEGGTVGGNVFVYGEPLKITVVLCAMEDIPSYHIGVGICFRNTKGLDIITSTTFDEGNRLEPLHQGKLIKVTFVLENILAEGDYALVINVEERSTAIPQYYDYIENAVIIKSISQKLIHSLVLPNVMQKIEVL